MISGEGIRQLTNDHSFVAEAVKRGQSEAEAMAGPWRDALTRSIGVSEDVEVDVFGPMDVTANSALLVCSDGLYKTLPDGELLSIYARSGGARGAAQSLVSSAFENGSDDNISVAIAEYGEVRSTAAGGTMPLDHAPPAGDLGEAEAGAAELPEAEGAGGEPAADVAAEGDERPVAAAGVGSLPVGALVAAVVVIGALLGLLVLR